MAGEESNIPIRVDEESLERIEAPMMRREMRSVEAVDFAIPRIKDHDADSMAMEKKKRLDKTPSKKLAPRESFASKPFATMTSFPETVDSQPSSLQDQKRSKAKSLKRKKDHDDDHDETIRNLYGYGDTSTSSSPTTTSTTTTISGSRVRIHFNTAHAVALTNKRHRPMRRNSFYINPKTGRGAGPFPGISHAIEEAVQGHQNQAAAAAAATKQERKRVLYTESHHLTSRHQPLFPTIHTLPHRLADSTNASLHANQDEEQQNDEKADSS